MKFFAGHCRSLAVAFALAALVVSPVARSQAVPDLGEASSFAVLGASTVVNTGPTVVTGNVGVTPGTAIVGFPPGVVVGGTLHANDAAAQQARASLFTAYNGAAGTACTANLTGSNLGGLTLTPGVYCFDTSAQLTGELTLDALGNPGSVFIFKVGSTLTTASGSRVRLINSGSTCNVFWQVGSSATLGTGTTFAGTIVALTSVTLTTGANVSGRTFGLNGAVTLDSNTITACTPPGTGVGPGPGPIGAPAQVATLSPIGSVAMALLLLAGVVLVRRAKFAGFPPRR